MPILGSIGSAAAKGFGMLGKVAAAVDEYFKYVTLLLHGNGTNGAQNNTFLDSSTNNFTITRNGNTTQGTFTPYGSNWSNYFDGSGDYLSDIGTTSSFNFLHNTTALFTFECWVYVPSTAAEQYLFDNTNGTSSQIGCSLSIVAGGALSLFITRGVTGVGNVTAYVISTGTVPTNQWVHVAVTYDQSLSSNNAKFYINGVAAGSGNKTGNTPSSSNASNALRIGCAGAGAAAFITGYISNLRIVNSIVYTSAFTPSTAPLTAITNTSLLTCQSNRFIDNSSNNFTITRNGDVSVQRFSPFAPTAAYSAATVGGSGYFDGSGDYLTTPNGSSFAFGTGDFTIEGWFYLDGTNQGLADVSGGTTGYWMWVILGGTMYWQNVRNGSNLIIVSLSNYLSQWVHFAVVRNSGTTRIYQNGTQIASASDSTNYSGTAGDLNIGRESANPSVLKGYMSNFRIVKGTAVYTSAFTPPTAPLTAITNTQLLLNFTNGGIIDNAMMNDLETVGNAQISTSVSKFGGGSIAFDGTGDYLVVPSSPNIALGTGDFTIECWTYFTSLTNKGVFQISATAGGLQTSQTNTLAVNYDSGGSGWGFYAKNTSITGSGTNPLNAWVHIALVRGGTTTTLYVNGTNTISTTSDTTNYTGTYICVGGYYSTSYLFTGYIDDLRITKGYARYTANFTPPTLPFPDQ